jgi:hypothetical protein
MLNHVFWVFSTGEHPLRRLLAVLLGLNSTKMNQKFGMVDDYPLEPLLHVPNFNDVVEKELISVEKDSSSIFSTDVSKGGAGTDFGVQTKAGLGTTRIVSGGLESSFRLRESIGVLTSEMTVIFFGFDSDKGSLFWWVLYPDQ